MESGSHLTAREPGLKEDQMTTTFASETDGSFVLSAFVALIEGFRTIRDRRARRLAIASLLELDPSRLDDLGINVGDIREALSIAQPAGARLDAHRRARALSWTPNAGTAA
jgi:uncharacterized protein YjiS (DUF1127 family)